MKSSKLVESFLLLNRFGEGLLHRLFHTKKWLARTKSSLAFYSDKNVARVAELATKKFPELPEIDKVGGHEEFIAQAGKLVEMTRHVYELILDILDWKAKARAVLLQAANAFPSGLTLVGQPFLLRHFLRLVSLYCKVLILLSEVPDRRLIIAVHFNAHKFHLLNGGDGLGPLTTGSEVEELFTKYNDPVKRLHEDFPAAGSPFVQVLSFTILDLQGNLNILFSVPEILRHSPLSLSTDEGAVSLPVLSGVSTELSSFTSFRDWLVFSAILAPEAFREEGGVPIQLLTLALKHVYTIRIVRSEVFLIHSPLSSLFGRYKDASGSACLKKSRKLISNASGDAQTGEGPKHQHQLQVYLIQELRDLLNVFFDFPALLAPKFPLVLGALSLSRDAVIHYYEHIHHPPSGHKVKKGEGAANILTLIGLISQLLGLVEKNKQMVQAYYAEYLQGHHHRSLSRHTAAARSYLTSSEKQVLDAVISKLKAIDSHRATSNTLDLKALRLNWQRLELSFSISGSSSKAPGLAERGRWIALHSRYLDEWPEVLRECSSFHLLWSYSAQVSHDFEQTLRSPSLSPFALSIFTILNHYPRIASSHFAEEKPAIAKFCVEDAERRCSDISSSAFRLLQEVWGQFGEWDTQINPTSTVATAMATLPNVKHDRKPPQPVGSESEYQARGALKGAEATQRTLIHLLRSFHTYPQCQVVDYSFSPIEYFRGYLQQQWRALLVRIATSSEGGLPVQICEVERKVNSLNSTVSWIESYVDLSLHEVFRGVWRDSNGVALVENREGDENPLSWITSEPLIFPDSSFIRVYAHFFVELVTSLSGQIIYSPTYNMFTNKQSLPPIENLTSVGDLRALCRMVGPIGFRCIHHGLLLEAGKRLVEMVGFCETNAKTLEGLEDSVKRLKNDKEHDSLVRSLKGVDGLQQACLSLGIILKLRQLLREAQKGVVEEITPHLYRAVSTAFNQYNTNLLLETQLLPADSYASDCGLEVVGGTDQGLVYIAKGSIPATSSHLIRLLPIAFATLFHHRVWGESTYVPRLGGYSNNLHLMALGMSQAIVNLAASQVTYPEDVLGITVLMESYLANATSVLLALSGEGPKKDSIFFSSEGGSGKMKGSFPHMVVFLESFLDSTCYLSREVLEKLLPYPLVRSMRQTIMNAQKK